MAEDKAGPLSEASTRIRDAAKWLTVSLAVLGGVLTAGTQVSSVGSLTPGSDRFWAAVIGGSIAALGAGLILMKSVATATTPAVSLATMPDPNDLDKDKYLLNDYASVKLLRKDFERAIEARNDASKAYNNAVDDAEREQARIKLVNANTDWDFLQKVVANVLRVASYSELAKTWRRSGWYIGAGALLGGIGVVIFVWAINPPKAAEGSAATPAVLSTATQGSIVLTDVGYAAIGGKLGTACANRKELPVLHLGDTTSGPDVLIQEPGCNAVRLVLGSDWGSFSRK